MQEYYEIRMATDIASKYFSVDMIHRISDTVVSVKVESSDPRAEIFFKKDLQLITDTKKTLYYSYRILRKYSKEELESSNLFYLNITKFFEPPGEECGTKYDYSEQCAECKIGIKQIGPLRLKKGKIPKADISKTIAGEVVVSENFVALYTSNNLKGFNFKRVYDGEKETKYYQPIFVSPRLNINNKTIGGVAPYDYTKRTYKEIELKLPDGRVIGKVGPEVYACTNGHTIGLNILSEVYVNRDTAIQENDFFETEQKVGVSRGYLRPSPLILCSPRARQVIIENKLKGFDFEVAHIVGEK